MVTTSLAWRTKQIDFNIFSGFLLLGHLNQVCWWKQSLKHACIKVSVESVAEYVISLYSILNIKQNTIFKTSGPTVNKILQKKNKFNIFYFCCFYACSLVTNFDWLDGSCLKCLNYLCSTRLFDKLRLIRQFMSHWSYNKSILSNSINFFLPSC